jgi:GNAT superfamily N-acetyltransferase
MNIEEFSQHRQEEVIALIARVWVEFGVTDDPRQEHDLPRIADFYKGGASGFWLAMSGNCVTGTAALKDLGNGWVALKRFYVAREWRGATAGTAQQLFEHLVRHARQHGAMDMCLGTIEVTLAAQRFYEKNGFQRVKLEEIPAEEFAGSMDTLFFKLSLNRS